MKFNNTCFLLVLFTLLTIVLAIDNENNQPPNRQERREAFKENVFKSGSDDKSDRLPIPMIQKNENIGNYI